MGRAGARLACHGGRDLHLQSDCPAGPGWGMEADGGAVSQNFKLGPDIRSDLIRVPILHKRKLRPERSDLLMLIQPLKRRAGLEHLIPGFYLVHHLIDWQQFIFIPATYRFALLTFSPSSIFEVWFNSRLISIKILYYF